MFSRVFSSIIRPTLLNAAGFSNNVQLSQSVNYPSRYFSVGSVLNCKENPDDEGDEKVRDASKDRTKVIPVETSIRYLQSSAYAETYGSEPVWKYYRRNHKGAFAPKKTRKTCIRGGQIATGNPCPICRDEYLVLKPENVELLKQFISPYTGETLSYTTTGVCQKKHQQLLIAIELAKDRGLIEFDVPFRVYDYSLYTNIK